MAAAADIEELCEVSTFRKSLLDWYDRNHRKLLWRYNPHSKIEIKPPIQDEQLRAYSVWVSEMMLQQTRVAAVIKYYEKWLEKWPTLRDLAQATQEEVNAVWAGLGYYRRARFLLEGAKYVMEKCDGVFPKNIVDLQQIPGIGKYTAGAIASVVFNEQVPVVDGNVIRAICRLRAIADSTKKATTVKLLWDVADELVDPERPGDFNQALMELGAVVCTATSPKCEGCPVATSCNAFQLAATSEEAKVTDFPSKTPKAPPREEFAAVCVVELRVRVRAREESYFLLVQRPEKGLLAGMWEFPSVMLESSTSEHEEAMIEYLKSLGLVLDEETRDFVHVGDYTHVFSHIRLNMRIERLKLPWDASAMVCSHKTKWVKEDDVYSLGLTSGVRKVFDMVRKENGRPKRRKRK